MGEHAGRVYFRLSLALGRMLRAGRYAEARVVREDGELRVRKRRLFYAPLLVAMGGPLVRVLGTGGRVLPQRAWETRERLLYEGLYGAPVRVDRDGTLVLPFLPGETLATLLEDRAVEGPARRRAVGLAVAALADLHRLGITHGDAMAENVMVALEEETARWFDFETVHDPSRPEAWRRADDVRALLATCLVRTAPAERAETVGVVVDGYRDEEVLQRAAASFATVWRRPLPFHLGQAGASYEEYREVAELLRGALASRGAAKPG